MDFFSRNPNPYADRHMAAVLQPPPPPSTTPPAAPAAPTPPTQTEIDRGEYDRLRIMDPTLARIFLASHPHVIGGNR